MAVIPSNPKFSNIQALLEGILTKSNFEGTPPLVPLDPPIPHKFFWRQTGNYDQDYTLFTTGPVPKVRPPKTIMNGIPGQELTSNFYVVLIRALPDVKQMPDGGPYITAPDYQLSVNDTMLSGQDIRDTIEYWLTHEFPK